MRAVHIDTYEIFSQDAVQYGAITICNRFRPFRFSLFYVGTIRRSVARLRTRNSRQRLLRDPKRSIIDAGLDAGFQNPSHFARMFRKFEGTTPSQFRADNMPRAIFPESAIVREGRQFGSN